MFIDEYEAEIDREFMTQTAGKILFSMDKHSEMTAGEFQKRYDNQVQDFIEYARKKEMIRNARAQEKQAKVNIDTTQARKEIESLFDLFK